MCYPDCLEKETSTEDQEMAHWLNAYLTSGRLCVCSLVFPHALRGIPTTLISMPGDSDVIPSITSNMMP